MIGGKIMWYEKKGILNVFASFLSITIGVAVLIFSFYMCGINVMSAIQTLYFGAIGTYNSISETLLLASILALISYGLTISFTANVWNIGAEGQYMMGAIASTVLSLTFKNLPGYILIPLSLVIGILAGLLWALLPGVLLVKYSVNEVLTTLMMNYIAQYILSWLVTGPLQDRTSLFPESPYIPSQAHLPRIIALYRINYISLILLIALAPLIYIIISKTYFGMSLRILGSSRRVAKYAGLNVEKLIISSLLISGALSGLAGAIEILGIQYRLRPGIVQGYGYTGIVITLVGNMHPYGCLLASIFIASLMNGISQVCQLYQLPIGLTQILQSIFLITFVSVKFLLEYLSTKRIKIYGE